MVDGFEEVVDSACAECVEGVLVVGGGEDDWAGYGGVFEDVGGEAVGEVEVHEYEVGFRIRVLIFVFVFRLVCEVVDGFFDALEDGEMQLRTEN